jgi:polyisoprenoid-binding protein YceI
MKRFIITLAVAALAAPLFADTYAIDKAHSEATFTVRHFVTNVRGRFNDFSGTITGDLASPETASVEFTIKAASIDTNAADRDNHLRSADFFDVANHPEITFRSVSIKPSGTKNLFNVMGNLTMRGVTKQVTLPVQFLGFAKDPRGTTRAGFSLQTKINRKDYGINWNKALDNGGFMLSDDVDLTIDLETVKK